MATSIQSTAVMSEAGRNSRVMGATGTHERSCKPLNPVSASQANTNTNNTSSSAVRVFSFHDNENDGRKNKRETKQSPAPRQRQRPTGASSNSNSDNVNSNSTIACAAQDDDEDALSRACRVLGTGGKQKQPTLPSKKLRHTLSILFVDPSTDDETQTLQHQNQSHSHCHHIQTVQGNLSLLSGLARNCLRDAQAAMNNDGNDNDNKATQPSSNSKHIKAQANLCVACYILRGITVANSFTISSDTGIPITPTASMSGCGLANTNTTTGSVANHQSNAVATATPNTINLMKLLYHLTVTASRLAQDSMESPIMASSLPSSCLMEYGIMGYHCMCTVLRQHLSFDVGITATAPQLVMVKEAEHENENPNVNNAVTDEPVDLPLPATVQKRRRRRRRVLNTEIINYKEKDEHEDEHVDDNEGDDGVTNVNVDVKKAQIQIDTTIIEGATTITQTSPMLFSSLSGLMPTPSVEWLERERPDAHCSTEYPTLGEPDRIQSYLDTRKVCKHVLGATHEVLSMLLRYVVVYNNDDDNHENHDHSTTTTLSAMSPVIRSLMEELLLCNNTDNGNDNQHVNINGDGNTKDVNVNSNTNSDADAPPRQLSALSRLLQSCISQLLWHTMLPWIHLLVKYGQSNGQEQGNGKDHVKAMGGVEGYASNLKGLLWNCAFQLEQQQQQLQNTKINVGASNDAHVAALMLRQWSIQAFLLVNPMPLSVSGEDASPHPLMPVGTSTSTFATVCQWAYKSALNYQHYAYYAEGTNSSSSSSSWTTQFVITSSELQMRSESVSNVNVDDDVNENGKLTTNTNTPLADFHAAIGPLLDVMQQKLQLQLKKEEQQSALSSCSQTIKVPYMEYCAVRDMSNMCQSMSMFGDGDGDGPNSNNETLPMKASATTLDSSLPQAVLSTIRAYLRLLRLRQGRGQEDSNVEEEYEDEDNEEDTDLDHNQMAPASIVRVSDADYYFTSSVLTQERKTHKGRRAEYATLLNRCHKLTLSQIPWDASAESLLSEWRTLKLMVAKIPQQQQLLMTQSHTLADLMRHVVVPLSLSVSSNELQPCGCMGISLDTSLTLALNAKHSRMSVDLRSIRRTKPQRIAFAHAIDSLRYATLLYHERDMYTRKHTDTVNTPEHGDTDTALTAQVDKCLLDMYHLALSCGTAQMETRMYIEKVAKTCAVVGKGRMTMGMSTVAHQTQNTHQPSPHSSILPLTLMCHAFAQLQLPDAKDQDNQKASLQLGQRYEYLASALAQCSSSSSSCGGVNRNGGGGGEGGGGDHPTASSGSCDFVSAALSAYAVALRTHIHSDLALTTGMDQEARHALMLAGGRRNSHSEGDPRGALPAAALTIVERMIKFVVKQHAIAIFASQNKQRQRGQDELNVNDRGEVSVSDLDTSSMAIKAIHASSGLGCFCREDGDDVNVGEILIHVLSSSDSSPLLVVHVLVTAIRSLGNYFMRYLHHGNSHGNMIEPLWNVYETLVNTSVSYCNSSKLPLESQSLYRAMVLSVASHHCASSISVTSSQYLQPNLNVNVQEAAAKWMAKACHLLETLEHESGGQAQDVAVDFKLFLWTSKCAFRTVLIQGKNKSMNLPPASSFNVFEQEAELEAILRDCCQAQQLLSSNPSTTVAVATQSLTKTASWLYGRFHEVGVFVSSAKCAALVAQLSKQGSRDCNALVMAGRAFMDGGLHDMAHKYLMGDDDMDEDDDTSSPMAELVHLDRQANQLALLVQCSSSSSGHAEAESRAYEQDLQRIVSRLTLTALSLEHKESTITESNNELLLLGLLEWTKTTCLLSLSQLYQTQAQSQCHQLDKSLASLKECVQICQTQKKMALRRRAMPSPASPTSVMTMSTTMSLEASVTSSSGRWTGRLAHTLTQLAQCYSLKGDRRQADIYATASLKALHVTAPHSRIVNDVNIGNEGDDAVTASVSVSLSCRQAEALRQSQDIKSHASSSLTTMSISQSSSLVIQNHTDSDDLDTDGTQMHWQLHHIKSLMSRGDQLRQSMGMGLCAYSDSDLEQVQAHDLYQQALDMLSPLRFSDKIIICHDDTGHEEELWRKKRSDKHDSHSRPDPDPPFDKRFAQLYNQLLLRMGLCLDLDSDLEQPQQHQRQSEHDETVGDTIMDRNVNANMDSQHSGSNSSFQDIYQQLRGSPYATCEDRLQATYQLGCLALKEAHRNGSLQQLWGHHHHDEDQEHAHSSSSSSLDLARHYLNEVCDGMPMTSQLCRHALRCLALATGPGDAEGRTSSPSLTASSLLLQKSLGASACATVADAYRQGQDEHQLRLFESLHNMPLCDLGGSVERQLTNHLPLEWNVVTMTLCPVTRDVLVSSLSRDSTSNSRAALLQSDTQCLTLNTDSGSSTSSSLSFQQRVLQPFHSIMVRNKRQLHGMDPDHVAHYGTKEARKMWWTDRRALDDELGALLEQTQQDYFYAPHIKQMFAARERVQDHELDHKPDDPCVNANVMDSSLSDDDDDDIQMTNLANKFDAVAVPSSAVVMIDNEQLQDANDKAIANALSKETDTDAEIKARTIPQLKAILVERFGVPKSRFRGMRKAHLVELFLQQQEQHQEEAAISAAHHTSAMEEGHQEDVSDSEDCIIMNEDSHNPSQTRKSCGEPVPSSHPQQFQHHYYFTPTTFLILDEQLQCFPWESLPLFQNKNASVAVAAAAVCRVPSLPFLLSPLLVASSTRRDANDNVTTSMTINPSRVSYVLDPESNLTLTQTRVGDALQDIQIDGGFDIDANVEWQGVMGELPTEAFMQQALTKTNNNNINTSQGQGQTQGAGLYLFCGHGGGTKAFSRVQVEELMYTSMAPSHDVSQQHDKAAPSVVKVRRCQSSVILMGCSSGKLSSNFDEDYSDASVSNTTSSVDHVGVEHGAAPPHPTPPPLPYYEASGLALSYLQAGAPCVVANLWDVTDGDIDKYCIQLLRDFFLNHGGQCEGEDDQGESEEAGDPSAPFNSSEHGEEGEDQEDGRNKHSKKCKPTLKSQSLAHHVALARSACKLRYLVGSAPVCYGVPVFLSS
jgi:hypothetical protein